MPSIISRAYADKATADKAKAALLAAGYPASAVVVGAGKDAQFTASDLGSKGVAAAAAAAESGKGILIVRAPFGTAYRAGVIADGFSPVAVPGIGNDPYVMEDSRNRLSQYILLDHRRFATNITDVQNRGPITAAFGFPLLSTKTRSRSAYSGTHRFGAFLMPLLSRKPRSISAYQGTRRFGAFLVPLLSRR